MCSAIRSLRPTKAPAAPWSNACCTVIRECGISTSGRSPEARIRLYFSTASSHSIISTQSMWMLVSSSNHRVNLASSSVPEASR